MAQAKRKTATRTAKKTTAKKTQCRKQSCTRTAKSKGVTQEEKMHVYFVTAMAIIAAILLCADAAMMIA